MAWFAFGSKPGSWAVANQTLLDYQNMPDGYEGKFKMNEWNSNTIGTIATGGRDYYSVYLRSDGYNSYGPEDMIPLIKVDFLGRGRPFHVAFAPGGMWFIRFKPIGSGAATTVWGPACAKAEPPVYPSSWVSIVDELRDAPNVPRDEHAIDFVTFGCHDLIIVRFENGNAQICPPSDPALRAKCSETVIKLVEEKIKEGWTVGNRTTLCQYDPEQYFIEWRKGTQANFAFNVGTQESVTRVKNVLDLVGNDAVAQQMANEARMIVAQNQLFQSQIMAANSWRW